MQVANPLHKQSQIKTWLFGLYNINKLHYLHSLAVFFFFIYLLKESPVPMLHMSYMVCRLITLESQNSFVNVAQYQTWL